MYIVSEFVFQDYSFLRLEKINRTIIAIRRWKSEPRSIEPSNWWNVKRNVSSNKIST